MNTWLVNSNIKNNSNAFKYMLRQGKVSSFYQEADRVDKLQQGDLVLLYHNNNRIIAVGSVLSQFDRDDFTNDESTENWSDVNWLWKARLNEHYEPIEHIDRNTVGVTNILRVVNRVTDQVDYRALMVEIASKQSL
jgi:predicted Mrr-cat superfamily restriction endonuclease